MTPRRVDMEGGKFNPDHSDTPCALPRLTRVARYVLPFYLMLQLTLTHLPKQTIEKFPVSIWDKASHFIAYGGLGLLLMLAFGRPGGRVAAMSMGLLLTIGAVDELTQPLVGRGCELSDWIADGLGGGALIVLTWLVLRQAMRTAK